MTGAKRRVMQGANDDNARRRGLLLAALGIEDDGRTGLDEYIQRLVADRDAVLRDRDGARDALRRVQDRHDALRVELDQWEALYGGEALANALAYRQRTDAEVAQLRGALREALSVWSTTYDGILVRRPTEGEIARWRTACGLNPPAPQEPDDPDCATCGHRAKWHEGGRCAGDLLHCECPGYAPERASDDSESPNSKEGTK